MNKSPKRRIKVNVWGNWYGYEGSRRVIAFANDPENSAEDLAQHWLKTGEHNPAKLNGPIRFGGRKVGNYTDL